MRYYDTHVKNSLVKENSFIGLSVEETALPLFDEVKHQLPQPLWEGHASAIQCYWKTWEIAFGNLRKPVAGTGFVSNFIDTAFNGCLFMWDSAFILLFAKYGRNAFNFQRTLDNLYAKQHPDGFISREIRENSGQDQFERFDPVSTGPNIMPWTEWEYYQNTNDQERLSAVFPVLLAYYRWLRMHRTWKDGSYWSSGWACGMDNQPRLDEGYDHGFHHGHMTWIDMCLQQVFSAKLLQKMSNVLGRDREINDIIKEIDYLEAYINKNMWDDVSAFYYDRKSNGELSQVKSIGAYWALLAGIVPDDRLDSFIDHLNNINEFNRPHRIPTLSKDHFMYDSEGGYWRGSVWAPTNYMVLSGLTKVGYHALAYDIAVNHHAHVVKVFEETDTLWENYAPERAAKGNRAKPNFVGWTGLPPVAVLFEHIFGLHADVPRARLVWNIQVLDMHGVAQYPFGPNGLVNLKCNKRASIDEEPTIEATSSIPLELEIRWKCGNRIIKLHD